MAFGTPRSASTIDLGATLDVAANCRSKLGKRLFVTCSRSRRRGGGAADHQPHTRWGVVARRERRARDCEGRRSLLNSPRA
jgi:hypothetical protein